MKPFFVYMLRCGDGTYYVGHTDDLESRVAGHHAGEVEGYTSGRRPVDLVWVQETGTREEALAAELRIKGWSRAKKEALIRADWERIKEGPAQSSTRHHPSPQPHTDPLLTPLLQGRRRALAKVITLLESTRADHRQRADALLNTLLPHTGRAIRLGISGVPGVGKSTFIESLGLYLIAQGHRVAVLAIDPSSTVSGGSILGDKTRMEKLSVNDQAYVRPSPASGTLGGVAEKTREAMLVCEAAGYDVVIVETVGVGQSETAVAHMTDMFVLLQLPNAGDDLQAIKRGVMELADMVVINKADLDPGAATRAEATITSALRILASHGHATHAQPRVMQISALKGQGIDEFWAHVERFGHERRASGEFDARRRRQALAWMWELIQARLQTDFRHHPAVREALPATLHEVAEALVAPTTAARTLLALFERGPHPDEEAS